jgi:hypothetical protein
VPLIPACRRWSKVDELEGYGRDVTWLEGFGHADGAFDGQHVLPRALSGKIEVFHVLPQTVTRTRTRNEPKPRRGPPARSRMSSDASAGQADEGAGIGAAGIPYPRLGIERDHHEFSITRQTDSLLGDPWPHAPLPAAARCTCRMH